ncbi:MAG: hypothetical protein CMO55_13875 [Verrucomicrobiales bacterium]|nr:hypothetical protein [Verrucomicrobiales bacterium]
MGTSKGSSGPVGGVPLIPSWVDTGDDDAGSTEEIEKDHDNQEDSDPSENQNNPKLEAPPPVLAPVARFRSARSNLKSFGETGDKESLKRGLAHYSRRGLGGSVNAGARMGKTSQTAQRLVDTFSRLRDGEELRNDDREINREALRGKSAREIGDIVIEIVRPSDGTQDAEANRESLNSALSEVAQEFEDLDFASLTDDQMEFLVERYVGHDICHRIELDVGQVIIEKSGIAEGYRRLEEMLEFVHGKVHAEFDKMRATDKRISSSNASAFTNSIIVSTFNVFEEYLH